VKLLFLDNFYLKNDLDYNQLRNLLDLRGNYQQIPFKNHFSHHYDDPRQHHHLGCAVVFAKVGWSLLG